MDRKQPARILVIRLGSIGDVIHALPAVASLKRAFPRAHLSWAIEPRWAPLLRDNPFVDQATPMPLDRWRRLWPRRRCWTEALQACRELRRARYDAAIDFQGLIKSALVAAAAGPERILGFHQALLREKAAALFYSHRVRAAAAHVVDQNMELAAALGAADRRIEFPLPVCAPEGELPEGDFVLASPMAGWTAKQWPAAHYARLAELLGESAGLPLVINCAPADREAAEQIAGQAPRGWRRLNVSSLEGLIGVTRRARAVIGVDSGPLHIAAALRKPGVALFGPTDPARNGPYGDTFVTLRSPQAVTSYRRGASLAASMWALRPEQVLQALQAQLARDPVLEPHR